MQSHAGHGLSGFRSVAGLRRENCLLRTMQKAQHKGVGFSPVSGCYAGRRMFPWKRGKDSQGKRFRFLRVLVSG